MAERILGGGLRRPDAGDVSLDRRQRHSEFNVVMTKEIFGPVLPIRVVDDLDEALALANNTFYGLTSSVFTQNLNAAMKAANSLRFGETCINCEHFEAMQGFHAGRRKCGISGADGKHGLYEYMETQVVHLQTQQ
ncbi:MAG: hypothetical protein RIQ60_2037 [Pseudomonadota bacterium]|jgi:lactaldehyde dehydrogenase/glycolaldehyde dehydrogenase